MLLNGSAVSGLTKQVQDAILKLYPKAKIIDRDTAKAVYEHSMLVDMTGNFSTIAATIAKSLNVTLSSLPAAEATSGAGYDLLLIAGKDWK